MLTSNFKKLIFGIFMNTTVDGSYVIPSDNVTFKKTNGQNMVWTAFSDSQTQSALLNDLLMTNIVQVNTGSSDTRFIYFRVGTGTTNPTPSDYDLENVNTDIVCTAVNTSFSDSTNTKVYNVTFSNPTASDITLTEIGMYGKMPYYYNGYKTDYVMLDRTILDTPVTIPAGESRTLMYELTM